VGDIGDLAAQFFLRKHMLDFFTLPPVKRPVDLLKKGFHLSIRGGEMQAAGSTLLINLPKLSARPAEIGALQKEQGGKQCRQRSE